MWPWVLLLALVITLFVIALVAVVRSPASRGRGMLGVALGLMALGAALWLMLSQDEEIDVPWLWVLSIGLAAIAPLAVTRPRAGASCLLAASAIFPVVAEAVVAATYVFGEGVSDGAGGSEPWMGMAFVALMGSMAFSVPAVLVALLLLEAARPEPLPPPGWYPMPGTPDTERFWDGAAWADSTRPTDGAASASRDVTAANR